MKDIKYVVGFVAIGLILAYLVSAPLRRDPEKDPKVGTSLTSARIYAQGTIELDKSLEQQTKESVALFVIARSPSGGPPIAVQKHDFPSFPFSFSLTQSDNMVGDEFYDGPLTLVARLDKDGIVGPLQPEDFEGSVSIAQGQPRKVSVLISQAAK